MSDCCCTDSAACGCDSEIMTASTVLTAKDYWGTCKVRFGFGRMEYKVDPGVYALGNPSADAPVLVSANYKLTFDVLRSQLTGVDCWLLILDTNGINVWCAAGKGTFGTEELVHRIAQTGLSQIVRHRRLILPQLGAPHMKAHEVAQQTGFTVVYGPVRAADLKEFLAHGMQATQEMRTVKFTIWDRLVLTPVELVAALRKSWLVFGTLFLLNLFAVHPFGVYDLLLYMGAVLVGTVLTPVLLPWIPGRAFSLKGWLLGLLWTAAVLWRLQWLTSGLPLLGIGYLLLLPSVSAWFALNFTGSSTYTSPSGVTKEMQLSLPFIIGLSIVGGVLVLVQNLLLGRFL
ncbi:MAG: mercury methylation corrinoid protein HgcA [Lachnospiraceae bacterium]